MGERNTTQTRTSSFRTLRSCRRGCGTLRLLRIRHRPAGFRKVLPGYPLDILSGYFVNQIHPREHHTPVAVLDTIEGKLCRKPRVAVELPDEVRADLRLHSFERPWLHRLALQPFDDLVDGALALL